MPRGKGPLSLALLAKGDTGDDARAGSRFDLAATVAGLTGAFRRAVHGLAKGLPAESRDAAVAVAEDELATAESHLLDLVDATDGGAGAGTTAGDDTPEGHPVKDDEKKGAAAGAASPGTGTPAAVAKGDDASTALATALETIKKQDELLSGLATRLEKMETESRELATKLEKAEATAAKAVNVSLAKGMLGDLSGDADKLGDILAKLDAEERAVLEQPFKAARALASEAELTKGWGTKHKKMAAGGAHAEAESKAKQRSVAKGEVYEVAYAAVLKEDRDLASRVRREELEG